MKTHQIHFESKQDKNKSNNGTSVIDLDYFLMMFIITAGLNFRCVEKKYFKKYSEGLKSTYKIANGRKVSNLVNNYYEKKKKRVEEKLKEVVQVTLSTDCWSSVQNFSYLALTAHYLNLKMKIESLCLAVKHILGIWV